jgi:hypothetical protein
MFHSRTALWFRAREISDQLAQRLRVLAPFVEISDAPESSYQPDLIWVGKQYQGMEEAFLLTSLMHEMAHHLERERYFLLTTQERLAEPREFLGDLPDLRAYHGEAFCQALLDVVRAWYGTPRQHDWVHENAAVYAWALRQGYAH